MRPVDPFEFAKSPTQGGSARVSDAVARAVRARRGGSDAAPRDPAPSRAAYRMSRLWLTPSFRFFMRRIAPVLGIAALCALWFSVEENRLVVTDAFAEAKRDLQNRPEFMVKLMAVDGASPELSEELRAIAAIDFPQSSFDIDLPVLLKRIEAHDAVAEAGIRVRAGGILQVDVTERVPAILWRSEGQLNMLDAEGNRVATLESRLDRPDLPLIAGEGAGREVAEALSLIKSAAPLSTRLRGLVRVGERRWDIVLDRDQIIRLPETNPRGALAQVIALNQAKDLLERDIRIVDMRNPARPTLQLTEPALDEMRRIRALEFGVSYQ